MLIELKYCPICDKSDWHSLDHHRDPKYWFIRDQREEDEPVGFKVCKACGFTTYDYIDNDRLAAHYDRERPIMSHGNIITCNRKNLFHEVFLDELFFGELAKESPFKLASVVDIGMAQGAFLNFLSEAYGVYDLYGTEWSKAFLNFAKYEYGINGTNEIDTSRKYDLVSCYHVLEHLQYPDVELKKMVSVMEDDGLIYISVPVWGESLDQTDGNLTVDFENYYHLNHVNVFSVNSFHNLLDKCGLEVIKKNDTLYAYTVMCKKTSPKTPDRIDDYKVIDDRLGRQKKAIHMFNTQVTQTVKNVDALLDFYPNYPDMWIVRAQNPENMKDFEKQKSILLEGLEKTNTNPKILFQLGIFYFQWDENAPDKQFYSNNIKTAEKIFKSLLDIKPSEHVYFMLGTIEMKYKKNYDKAVEYFRRVYKVSPNRWAESMDYIAKCWKEK